MRDKLRIVWLKQVLIVDYYYDEEEYCINNVWQVPTPVGVNIKEMVPGMWKILDSLKINIMWIFEHSDELMRELEEQVKTAHETLCEQSGADFALQAREDKES